MKKYKFVGEGAGVPGLPHEITDTEADALGLSELLEAAVGCGNYREAAPPPTPPHFVKPKMERGDKSVKKELEVSE